MQTVTHIFKLFAIGAMSTAGALAVREYGPDFLDFPTGVDAIGNAPVRLAIGGTIGAWAGTALTGTGIRTK